MRHISLILIAMAALLLGACQADDAAPSVSEEALFPSASAGASTAASTDASADASASESVGSSASPESSASPDDSDDADASPDDSDDADASPDSSDDATGGTGGTGDDACDEAFADVPELTSVDSLTALQDVFTAIDGTIEACDSADQWTELASDELALVDSPEDAEEFLRARCDESEQIEDSDICEEL